MNSESRSSAVSFTDEAADDDQSLEESSWTMYFEDFSKNNNGVMDEENSCFSSDHINYQTSSLVSDAACSATRHVFGAGNNNNKLLSFKKRKKTDNKRISLVEDDLEDTASSPANSPKVCNLVNNHFEKNLIKQKEVMNICHEKGSGSRQIDERNIGGDDEFGLNIERENEGTHELKKMGLCLVPLSMVVHYLG